MGCISVSEVVRAKGQGQSLDLWIIEGRDWCWVITSLSVIYEWAKLQLLDASVSWHEKSTMLLWELLPCLFIFWLFGLKTLAFFPKVNLPLDLWTTLFNAAQFFPLMQMCVNHEQAPFPSSLGELGTLQGGQLVLSSRTFRNWCWKLPRGGAGCGGLCTKVGVRLNQTCPHLTGDSSAREQQLCMFCLSPSHLPLLLWCSSLL